MWPVTCRGGCFCSSIDSAEEQEGARVINAVENRGEETCEVAERTTRDAVSSRQQIWSLCYRGWVGGWVNQMNPLLGAAGLPQSTLALNLTFQFHFFCRFLFKTCVTIKEGNSFPVTDTVNKLGLSDLDVGGTGRRDWFLHHLLRQYFPLLTHLLVFENF